MAIARKAELQYLEKIFKKDGNTFMVLYGREGIGKHEILKKFCKDKAHFYYRARNASSKEQRLMFGAEIEAEYQVKVQSNTYDEFFKRIRSRDGSKLVFIIDEFQMIVKRDPEYMDSIGRLLKKELYMGNVMIIMVSSSIAWVENRMIECLGKHARKIGDIFKVKEVNFLDVVREFPNYSTRECVEAYGVLGGVPEYLRRWDGDKNLKDNICAHILSKDGFLFREAENYIGQELRELSCYDTILATIASGKMKLNELFMHTEYSRAKISVYMKNLSEFEVVEKVYSFETGGWENAKKGVYQIKNTFINFWFRFVYPHMSDLYRLEPEQFFDRYIAKELDQYLNQYFIKVCMEYLELMSKVKQLPIEISKMGTWVGKKGNIDIIAQNTIREKIVGMCNWSEASMTYEVYEELLHNMELAKVKTKKYYLFSAKSFDERLQEAAKTNSDIILIDMNRL